MDAQIMQPSSARKWYQIWWDVWTRPGADTFERMLSEPRHDMSRGLIWVAVTSVIAGIITGLLQSRTIDQLLSTQMPGSAGQSLMSVYTICSVIVTPIAAIIGVLISSGIYHLLARIFHATGTWNDLVYCLSAVYAPGTLLGALISLLYLPFLNNPVLVFLPVMVAMVFAIYSLILNVIAISAAEKISGLQAVGTILIPIVVVTMISVCCILSLIPYYTIRQ